MNNQPTEDKILTHEVPHTFEALGVSEKLLSVLRKLNFTTPTPIQQKAIPIANEGKDLVGIAQTGTGKSLAFGLPMLQRLLETHSDGRGLIILPTRELATQINDTLYTFGRQFGLRTAVLIGGAPMYPQINQIKNKPNIIIGTPGRINDHIKQKTLNLHNISILVLDEADCMFDMGFAPQIKQILLSVPKNRQTMLFSATMPDSILNIATMNMKLPVRVEIARQGSANEKVDHELFFVRKDFKKQLLEKLLKEYKGTVLVFCRTKHSVKKISQGLFKKGFSASEIHSDRSLSQRKMALDGFKSGKYRILVATDIASRGIDVKGIELVINFDLPESPGDYVHRIGRTGRAGMAGKAISLVTPDLKYKVKEIERLIRSTIPILQLPEMLELPDSSSTEIEAENEQQQSFERKSEGRNKSDRFGSKPFKKRFDKSKPRFQSSDKSEGSSTSSFRDRSESRNKSSRFGSSPFKKRFSKSRPSFQSSDKGEGSSTSSFRDRSENKRSGFFGDKSESRNKSSRFGSSPFKKRFSKSRPSFQSSEKSEGSTTTSFRDRSENKGSGFFERRSEDRNRSNSFGSKPFKKRFNKTGPSFHSSDKNEGSSTSSFRDRSENKRSGFFGDRSESRNKSTRFGSSPFKKRFSKSRPSFQSSEKPEGSTTTSFRDRSENKRSGFFGDKSENRNKSNSFGSKPFKKRFGSSNFKKRKSF